MTITQKIAPCLWFNANAEEVVAFYIDVFGGGIRSVTRYTEAGPGRPGSVLTIAFELAGQQFIAVNGGMDMPYTDAVSLSVNCESQAEIDRLWARLTVEGGKPVQCGWLKDKYGLSWQIVPAMLPPLLQHPDPRRAQHVMQAVLGMVKLDIAALQRAFDA